MLAGAVESRASGRTPTWLIAATAALALGILAMALAETNLWMHYLIDAGESISLVGLAFILVAGVYLYRAGNLSASLPMTLPWLLFPVITQGDQLIDNLSINWMRFIVHLLLAAHLRHPGRGHRDGGALRRGIVRGAAGRAGCMASCRDWRRWLRAAVARAAPSSPRCCSLLEMWVAVRYLGELMVDHAGAHDVARPRGGLLARVGRRGCTRPPAQRARGARRARRGRGGVARHSSSATRTGPARIRAAPATSWILARRAPGFS